MARDVPKSEWGAQVIGFDLGQSDGCAAHAPRQVHFPPSLPDKTAKNQVASTGILFVLSIER
jgi:hypothetical protein